MSESPRAERLARYRSDWHEAISALQPGSFPSSQDCEQVWSYSEFAAHTCLRHPDVLAELHRHGRLDRACHGGEMRDALAELLVDCQDETHLEAVLRQFRRTEMLRIVWRDLLGRAALEETLEDLSELADQCICQSLALLYGWLATKVGTPRAADGAEQQLIVLGMGKLGARELNLSSDIDLIFCYAEHGNTDGRRPLENEQFFTRLGRQLIHVLSRQTVDGFVFRVDMRLRPFGDSGPLVCTLDAMEHYYHSQARDWERYAMVKARPLTGSSEEVDSVMAMLQAFVYRRYIDFGVIESIRDMKQMIERELHKNGLEHNIKLGRGGIREIEFIGQAFQLVRGGREKDLQLRPIQDVLERLRRRQLMPDYAVQGLLDAYRFLRLTENRIQAWRDEQTHLLPLDSDGRARLAASMAFADWDAFEQALDRHRQLVHEQFGHVFVAPQAEPVKVETPLVAVWHAVGEEPGAEVALGAAGFADAAAAFRQLVDFRESITIRALPGRGRGKLEQLMPSLIEAAARTEQPSVTLERLLQLLLAIARRTAYLDLLVENPLAFSQLVRLVSDSSWVVAQLIHQPLLLDELLDPRRLYSPLRKKDLETELRTLMASVAAGDLEQEMERLRQFAQGNRLRVAAADLVGAIPLMVVSDYLCEIAEVTLQSVQADAFRDLSARHGRPGDLDAEMEHGFAIIGYGKLGGLELGYGSDLDLVFIHGSGNVNAMTDGRKQVANDLFYARTGQRVVHMLSTRTPSGQLYEVDMRLRPNGNAGHLVSSLNAFEKYQLHEAWTWEHQSLVRARPVAGDPAVCARFNAIRHQVLCRQRDPAVLSEEVRSMRQKMRASLDKSGTDGFHTKHGAGGLVDIEFIVQWAVLRWAHEHPPLTTWTDNRRLLDYLAAEQLLSGELTSTLWEAYRVYRGETHRRALQGAGKLVAADQWEAERAAVSEIWEATVGN